MRYSLKIACESSTGVIPAGISIVGSFVRYIERTLARLKGVHVREEQFAFTAEVLKLLGALPFFLKRVQLALVPRAYFREAWRLPGL